MTRIAFTNVRLIDPASGRDETGELLVIDGEIADLGPKLFDRIPADAFVIDGKGAVLAPAIVDMRVQLREPGEEHKENFDTAS